MRWEYVRTDETYIGMNEKTKELRKYRVFCCPKCKNEVTDWMLANAELNYCSQCGSRNYKPDLSLIKTCWFKAIVGVEPDRTDCDPNGCDNCSFFLPEPQWPKDKNEQDEFVKV